mgnify:CR=1 FL=1|tara:strand:+ start:488 stop:766 length:279 start_codon:yes stop_codon:yes gene_type:complete
MSEKVKKEPLVLPDYFTQSKFAPDYGDSLALEYLNFLVSNEYMPDEAATFYLELSRINQRPIHYFITEAMVEYFIYLSQEPDDDNDQEESIH